MRVLPFALAVLACACTSSLDLERFRQEEARSEGALNVTYADFHFTAKNMQSHLSEYLEVRLVDRNNALQAKVVYVDVQKPDFSVDCPKLVPKANAPYRIDWWADHNNTAAYDGIVGGINEKDHAWRRVLSDPLPEDVRIVDGRYDLVFLHDTAFVDVATDLQGNKTPLTDTLLPFKLGIVGAAGYAGKPIEMRVVDKGSGRLVAVHRRGRAIEGYLAEVTGVLDEETAYEISVWVDVDGDDRYTTGEPSWRLEALSSEAGVALDLDVSRAPQTALEEAK